MRGAFRIGRSRSMHYSRAPWPDGPLHTSGTEMLDASSKVVRYAGVNWPAHMETMVPEGLQHQSIATIVSKIKSVGMNAIRLTWAVEMVDVIFELGDDVPIKFSFIEALGEKNGTRVYDDVVRHNPTLAGKTRLEVFDAVAEECAKQEIFVHLDNHVSKAIWCCSPLDGNSYWGDHYFEVAKWLRALSFIADYAKKWKSVVSMSLRNELRAPAFGPILSPNAEPTSWRSWYENVKMGADAVHAANPDLVIFLPGQRGGRDLGAVVRGEVLDPGRQRFDVNHFRGYADKLVLEIHSYDNIDLPAALGGTLPGKWDCVAMRDALERAGFATLTDKVPNHLPLVVSEFGWDQYVDYNTTYVKCLVDYLAAKPVGWMIWQIGGSYYIREGFQNYNDTWGLLEDDWSDWRSPRDVERYLGSLARATLSFADESPQVAAWFPELGMPNPRLAERTNSTLLLVMIGVLLLIPIVLFPRRLQVTVRGLINRPRG
ncbi:glycoside hydrolase [Thozetella sp. PMI_491]|nr:glycoside hydrolase [Thozetella sp. PMI_491]